MDNSKTQTRGLKGAETKENGTLLFLNPRPQVLSVALAVPWNRAGTVDVLSLRVIQLVSL